MSGRLRAIVDQWHLRKVQARWAAATEAAPDLAPFDLRALRAEARGLRRQIDRVIHATDSRLASPGPGAELPRQPLGTDWAWRPEAWRGPLPYPGAIAATGRTELGDNLAFYHDCPLAEVILRQVTGGEPWHRAPQGLALEVFGFRGSFLSLAIGLPRAAVSGLKSRHLITVDAVVESDRPARGFARLNVRHGPNDAQLVSDLPVGRGKGTAEFDLAYAGLDETRIERAWLDLIFNDCAMTRITLRDVVVSRRPRAEL
jgi:hypothetical protein